tara:strand:- start:193 stop:825 length:633 start_codon:yes stop_codon:yes gene_type:complete
MNADNFKILKDIFIEVVNNTDRKLDESYYESAFCIELEYRQIKYDRQKEFDYFYKCAYKLGFVIPDVIVYFDDGEECICEFKARNDVDAERQIQMYINVTNINFAFYADFKNCEHRSYIFEEDELKEIDCGFVGFDNSEEKIETIIAKIQYQSPNPNRRFVTQNEVFKDSRLTKYVVTNTLKKLEDSQKIKHVKNKGYRVSDLEKFIWMS